MNRLYRHKKTGSLVTLQENAHLADPKWNHDGEVASHDMVIYEPIRGVGVFVAPKADFHEEYEPVPYKCGVDLYSILHERVEKTLAWELAERIETELAKVDLAPREVQIDNVIYMNPEVMVVLDSGDPLNLKLAAATRLHHLLGRALDYAAKRTPYTPSEQVRVSFDIGGVISRHPDVYLPVVRALAASPEVEVFILTDMDHEDALAYLRVNGLGDAVPDDQVVSADWDVDGELCKAKECEMLGIRLHVDDIPSYLLGEGTVGLLQMPSRDPYHHPSWVIPDDDFGLDVNLADRIKTPGTSRDAVEVSHTPGDAESRATITVGLGIDPRLANMVRTQEADEDSTPSDLNQTDKLLARILEEIAASDAWGLSVGTAALAEAWMASRGLNRQEEPDEDARSARPSSTARREEVLALPRMNGSTWSPPTYFTTEFISLWPWWEVRYIGETEISIKTSEETELLRAIEEVRSYETREPGDKEMEFRPLRVPEMSTDLDTIGEIDMRAMRVGYLARSPWWQVWSYNHADDPEKSRWTTVSNFELYVDHGTKCRPLGFGDDSAIRTAESKRRDKSEYPIRPWFADHLVRPEMLNAWPRWEVKRYDGQLAVIDEVDSNSLLGWTSDIEPRWLRPALIGVEHHPRIPELRLEDGPGGLRHTETEKSLIATFNDLAALRVY